MHRFTHTLEGVKKITLFDARGKIYHMHLNLTQNENKIMMVWL